MLATIKIPFCGLCLAGCRAQNSNPFVVGTSTGSTIVDLRKLSPGTTFPWIAAPSNAYAGVAGLQGISDIRVTPTGVSGNIDSMLAPLLKEGTDAVIRLVALTLAAPTKRRRARTD